MFLVRHGVLCHVSYIKEWVWSIASFSGHSNENRSGVLLDFIKNLFVIMKLECIIMQVIVKCTDHQGKLS